MAGLAGYEALASLPAFRQWLDEDDAPARVALRAVEVDPVTTEQAIARILGALDQGVGGTVITPNLHIARLAEHDAEIRETIASADLVLADGAPLVWASKIARRAVPERVAGSDLVVPLCEAAAVAGKSVYLLGGSEGTADACALELMRRIPTLTIAGTHCPPMGFEHDEAELATVHTKLADAQADIVLLALGSPKTERLMTELRRVVPSAWLIGVGMALGFIAGEQRRAPVVLQKTGLEWAHRLYCEPRRLARRYLVDGLPYAGRLGMWAVRQRFA